MFYASILFCSIFISAFLARVFCFSPKQFIPGPPLTEAEFQVASKIKFNEDNSEENLESEMLEDDLISPVMERRTLSIENYLWPNGIVPYELDEEYDEKGRLLIAQAFQEMQNKTCVRFIPRKDQKDYIKIILDKRCTSYVGHVGGDQSVLLGRGCYSLGIIMHELMHTLGFIHEQSRTDRDLYVKVIWENIKEGREDNFKIYPWYSDRMLKEKYDYSSILHYHEYAFSKDPKTKPTIESKRKHVRMGQRKRLSDGDISKINTAYRCHSIYMDYLY